MATGRRARTAELGLDIAGVDSDPRGHVTVDDALQTTNERIYAAGDVTNHPQFVYVAALGGSIAAENAIRGTSRKIDFTTMPRVTFATPAIASVGLTDQQARDSGNRVITSVLPIAVVPRAIVDHETGGVIKLVADETSGRLLGAYIVADGAGDVIQAAVMALRYRATIDEIAETYHPYLTMAEALKLAAQGSTRTSACSAAAPPDMLIAKGGHCFASCPPGPTRSRTSPDIVRRLIGDELVSVSQPTPPFPPTRNPPAPRCTTRLARHNGKVASPAGPTACRPGTLPEPKSTSVGLVETAVRPRRGIGARPPE